MVAVQDEEAVKMLTASAGTKSKLAKPIQDLIKMIFDVESMKKAMVEFEVEFDLLAQIRHFKITFLITGSVFFIQELYSCVLSFLILRSTSRRCPLEN